MFFCTGVGRKNVVLVEECEVRGTLGNKFIMTINVFIVGIKRLVKCALVPSKVAKMYFLLNMLRFRDLWNTRVNKCIMTITFLVVIIETFLEYS